MEAHSHWINIDFTDRFENALANSTEATFRRLLKDPLPMASVVKMVTSMFGRDTSTPKQPLDGFPAGRDTRELTKRAVITKHRKTVTDLSWWYRLLLKEAQPRDHHCGFNGRSGR